MDIQRELYNACMEGDLLRVERAIANGANVQANDNDALDALCWAASNGHLEVVKYLIANGANVQANDNEALRWAAQYGHLEVVEFLSGCELIAKFKPAIVTALALVAVMEVAEYLKTKIENHAGDKK